MYTIKDSLADAIASGVVSVSDRTDPKYDMYNTKGDLLGELNESQIAMMYKLDKKLIAESIGSDGFFEHGNVVYVPAGTKFG